MPFSIRLVTTWSGPLPRYLPLFLGTASRNPEIEFLFVADSPQPYALPPNVRWVERSLPDLLDGMSDRLGCDLRQAEPFKLCDVRPAFGVALADLLEGCDFWGNIDCDLVLGDLRAFATDERLGGHDILSFKGRRYVHGPLTLWRNDETVNRLYKRADWRRVFEADEYLGFDETCKRWGSDRLPPRTVAERQAQGEVPSISDVVYTMPEEAAPRIYDGNHIEEGEPHRPPYALRWQDGELYDTVRRRPLAFYHLLWTKRDLTYSFPDWRWDELPERFGISRQRVGPIGPAFYATQLCAIGHVGVRRIATKG